MLLIFQHLKVIKVQFPKPYKISSSYNLRMKTILNIITYGQANLYRKTFPTQKLQSTTPPSSLQHFAGVPRGGKAWNQNVENAREYIKNIYLGGLFWLPFISFLIYYAQSFSVRTFIFKAIFARGNARNPKFATRVCSKCTIRPLAGVASYLKDIIGGSSHVRSDWLQFVSFECPNTNP